jgi:6-phosphogluconolactonase
MYRIALTFLLLLPRLLPAQDHYLFVGTYASPLNEGVHVYRFNSSSGQATAVSSIASSNPSFITLSPNGKNLFAVFETAPKDGKGGDIAAYSFDILTGHLGIVGKELSGGDHPCHVEPDRSGRWLFASNYSSGTLSVLPIDSNGHPGPAKSIRHTGSGPDTSRQKGPHVHGSLISPDNRYLLVTDLGIDKVMIYAFDEKSGSLVPATKPYYQATPGAGPRQICFDPSGNHAYLIEELSGTVVFFKYHNGQLKARQRISTMVEGDRRFPGSADIHVSPDGKFLYASNRGEVNNIAIYQIRSNGKLQLKAHQSTLGKAPRYFSMDPSGNFLLCGNQNSDEIVIFKRDKQTGLLTDTGNRIALGKPVCMKWLSIPE